MERILARTLLPKQRWKIFKGSDDKDGSNGTLSDGGALSTTKSPLCFALQVRASVPVKKLFPSESVWSHFLSRSRLLFSGLCRFATSAASVSAVSTTSSQRSVCSVKVRAQYYSLAVFV